MMTLRECYAYMRESGGGLAQGDFSDLTLLSFLKSGCDYVADRLEYSRHTDTLSFALVEDQYEYPLPSSVGRVLEVWWNGQTLTLSSIEEWRLRGTDWRGATSGTPQEVALDGRRCWVVYPPPDADAMDADPAVTYSYTRGFTITDAGILGMPDMDVRMACQLAMIECLGSRNGDGKFDRVLASLEKLVQLRLIESEQRVHEPLDGYHPPVGAWEGHGIILSR